MPLERLLEASEPTIIWEETHEPASRVLLGVHELLIEIMKVPPMVRHISQRLPVGAPLFSPRVHTSSERQASGSSARWVLEALHGLRQAGAESAQAEEYRGSALDELMRKVWNKNEVELSLALFGVEYYERLLSDGGGGGRLSRDSTSSSLKFLCKAVNV